jgi:hypothetical protein
MTFLFYLVCNKSKTKGAPQQKLQTHTEHLSSPKYLVCNKSKTKGAMQKKLQTTYRAPEFPQIPGL